MSEGGECLFPQISSTLLFRSVHIKSKDILLHLEKQCWALPLLSGKCIQVILLHKGCDPA